MKENILIIEEEHKIYSILKEKFNDDDVNIIHKNKIDEEVFSFIKSQDISLFAAEVLIDNIHIVETIFNLKEQNIFIPIVIVSSLDNYRKELYEYGINIFFDENATAADIASACYNLFYLYSAKKDYTEQSTLFSGLIKTLEVRDPYTQGHSNNVSKYSVKIYDALGFKNFQDRYTLRIGGLIHDVGKVATPDFILKSDKKLSREELKAVELHPIDGATICREINVSEEIIDIVLHHHEKLDGSGYPEGIKENEISELSQITAIADIYDALTTNRSYRQKMPKEKALSIMNEEFVIQGKINSKFFEVFRKII